MKMVCIVLISIESCIILGLWNFFKKKNKVIHYTEEQLVEILQFHLMLVKIKNKRPYINVKCLLDIIYPDNNIDLNNLE
jgi:hypothetical protein